MIAQTEAQGHPHPRSAPSKPTIYRDAPTAAILAEAEAWLWDLAELEADLAADPSSWDFPQQSREFILFHLEQANEELARRERIRHRPEAPSWPARAADRRAELDAIKRRLPLADFIERMYLVRFQPSGKRLVTNCVLPGHQDASTSFTVWPEQDRFHCFGCGRSGDLFVFAQHALGLGSFREAVDVLREEARLASASAEGARGG